MNPSIPYLSIIIPLYNAASYIGFAIESIYRQEFASLGEPFEILIVNDGSTDGSDVIARQLATKHSEIQLIEQENHGVASARNAGIRQSRGEIICFMDADDEYPDGTLVFFVEELNLLRQQFGELVMVRGLTQHVRRDESGEDWCMSGEPIDLSVVHANAQTRAAVEKAGFFDEELANSEDIDWLLRAEAAGVVMSARQRVTLLYRRHETNMTRNASDILHHKLKMFKKHLDRERNRRASEEGLEIQS
ncbi:glycosyltransferase [bacterium]|nr:MAG: glycosyltransferase [bacterium]